MKLTYEELKIVATEEGWWDDRIDNIFYANLWDLYYQGWDEDEAVAYLTTLYYVMVHDFGF